MTKGKLKRANEISKKLDHLYELWEKVKDKSWENYVAELTAFKVPGGEEYSKFILEGDRAKELYEDHLKKMKEKISALELEFENL